MRERKKKPRRYTIGVVADTYGIHEQTLRLYEREGLLAPSRSEKNTRYYTDEDLEKLRLILSLTRDMGVNLAGVQIIMNMRQKMDDMQREFSRLLEFLRDTTLPAPSDSSHALVRTTPSYLVHIEQVAMPRRHSRRIKIETDDPNSEEKRPESQ